MKDKNMFHQKNTTLQQKIQIPPIWFSFIVSSYLIIDLLLNNYDKYSPQELLIFPLYALGVLLGQQIVLLFIFFRLNKEMPALMLSSIFFAVNLFSFYLLHHPEFGILEKTYKLAGIFVIAGIFFVILWQSKAWILTIACLLLIVSTIGNGYIAVMKYNADTNYVSIALPESFVSQDFIRTPNIYLLSFDALIPESLARHFLNLKETETVPYIETLKQANAQFIPNAFADYVPTAPSLDSLLTLDLDWWRPGRYYYIMHGYQRSPTYEIFKNNGYQIQLLIQNNPVLQPANNIVNLYSQDTKNSCTGVTASHVFWGYCRFRAIWKTLITRDNSTNIFQTRTQIAAQSATPHLTIAYISLPGHTSYNNYNFNLQSHRLKYRKFFLKKSEDTLAMIKQLIATIRKNDPDGIIIFFGDHGAYFTQGLLGNSGLSGTDDVPDDSPYSKTEIIQDQHGILMAVLDGGSGCRIQQGVLTTINDMMLNLIECLTGGKPVLKNRTSNEPRFIDYIYE